MKIVDVDYSWESDRCYGTNKNGKRCKNTMRKGYRRRNGEIVVYFTCFKHIHQEIKIRKELEQRNRT